MTRHQGLGAENLRPRDIFAEDLHEQGGPPWAANAATLPAKGTTSLEIIGTTEELATTKVEALGPRARRGWAWVRHGATKGHDRV